MTESTLISWAVAFRRKMPTAGSSLVEVGCFLQWSSDLDDEVSDCGTQISDHNVHPPPGRGVWVWEGVLEFPEGPDPDVFWVGKWRRITSMGEAFCVLDGVPLKIRRGPASTGTSTKNFEEKEAP